MVQGRSEQPSRAAVRASIANTRVSALDIGNLRPDAGCPSPAEMAASRSRRRTIWRRTYPGGESCASPRMSVVEKPGVALAAWYGRDAMGGGDVPTGVGKTALGVAMVRAEESRRGDRLFDDPYPAAFLAAAPGVFDREQRAAAAGVGGMAGWGAVFWSHTVIRTRFFDDYLLDAAGRGIRQVVLLAAGLDTRAYRLAWPAGVRLFELDLAGVLDFKQRVLDEQAAVPRCERRAIAADLREDWTTPLAGAGLHHVQPTAWLLEGMLIYLSADEAANLLTAVDNLSAPGSRVAFEFDDLDTDTMREQARTMPAMAEYAALWKGGLPDAAGWLAGHGWRPEVHNRAEVTARYGRTVSGPSTGGFGTATRA